MGPPSFPGTVARRDGGTAGPPVDPPSPVGPAPCADSCARPHLPQPMSAPAESGMPTSAPAPPAPPGSPYDDVLSDDGTRLRAWTNDPDGRIDGPTVVLCNGLGQVRWPGRRCFAPTAACGSSRGTTAAPAAPPAPRTRSGSASRSSSRTRLSVMDHYGVDRAVLMGWSMGVNTMFELAVRNPERVAGLFAVAGVPGDTFAHHARPAAAAARRRPRGHRQPLAGAEVHRQGAHPGHHPAAGRADARSPCSRTAASCCRSPTRSSRPTRSRSSSPRRSTGTSTSPCAPPTTPGSG